MTDVEHKLKNWIHTLVLFLGMVSILSVAGFILAGFQGIIWAIFLGLVILVVTPNLSPAFIFSTFGGKPLEYEDAPWLHLVVSELAKRAALPICPTLYYLRSNALNAFSVGNPANPAIGLSDTLLNELTAREIIAVLAHEISHIQHNDLRVMTYADTISRITGVLSFTGFLLVFLNLPLWLLGAVTISWPALIILIISPAVMRYFQLSLSRMREFAADHQAAQLTGDPKGLAMALAKLAVCEADTLDKLLGRGHTASTPSVLRTHPDTNERIERLLKLSPSSADGIHVDQQPFIIPDRDLVWYGKSRWHFGGYWY